MNTKHIFFAATAAFALLSTAVPHAAHADDAPPSAEALATEAFDKYQKGQYAEAVGLYIKSHKLSNDPRILFNIAQIYDKKLNDRDLAADYYRRYLKSPDAEPDLSKKSNDRLSTFKLEASQPAATTAAPKSSAAPASPPPAQTEPKPSYTAGWIATGVLAAGAVVTGVMALSASSDVKSGTYTGKTPPDSLDSSRSKAKTFALVTDVLGAAALVTGGVTLYLTLSSDKKGKETTVGVSPGRITVGGSF